METVTDKLVTRALNMQSKLLGTNVGSIRKNNNVALVGVNEMSLTSFCYLYSPEVEVGIDNIEDEEFLKRLIASPEGVAAQRRAAKNVMDLAVNFAIRNDLDSDLCILAIYDLISQNYYPTENIKADKEAFFSAMIKIQGYHRDVYTSWGTEFLQYEELDIRIIRLIISIEKIIHKRELVERLGAILFNQGLVRGKLVENIL